MTILVTGGTGLVGSRLLQRLAGQGVECRALVRGSKALPHGIARVEGDILDPKSLDAAFDGVSAIVHLAALFRTTDEDAIWKVNLEGTRNLIAAAQKHAPKARFIMASTGLVYDRNGARPGREDDVANPTQAYPASKLSAENELRASDLNWSILRLSFVYGEKDGHLEGLPQLAQSFKLHPATRFSMVHHRDVAALVDLVLSGALDKLIVNAADEAPASVYEIAKLVGAQIEPSSEPLTNPWYGQIDTALARRLGFRASVATVYQSAREHLL